MTRTSGRSTSRRSATSEDGACTVHDRAWVAGRVHREAASRAERPPRGQDGLGLLRERDHLVVAEPEAHRRRIVGGGASLGSPAADWLATRTNILRASW